MNKQDDINKTTPTNNSSINNKNVANDSAGMLNQSNYFSNLNSLNNLNSTKSKKFQMHTRKLIEIALEMLMKSQAPAIQYISLTTINRIFDIYVYHNLFYPGYYESCYIPLSKRQMNKQKQMQQDLNSMSNNLNQIKFQQNPVELNPANKISSNRNSQNLRKNKSILTSNQQYCTCLTPILKTQPSQVQHHHISYKLDLKPRDKSLIINEDPNSNVDDPSSIFCPPNTVIDEHSTTSGKYNSKANDHYSRSPSSLSPNRSAFSNSGLRTMAHRLSGFFRKFSTQSSGNSIQMNHNDSNLDNVNLDESVCTNCNKQIKNSRAHSNEKTKKNKKMMSSLGQSQIQSNLDEEDKENDDKLDKDFTTSVLVADIFNSSGSIGKDENKTNTDNSNNNNENKKQAQQRQESEAAEKNLRSEESLYMEEEDDTKNSANYQTNPTTASSTNASNSDYYQNQPYKFLANSIEPKYLLSIIKERLESHKKIDINASTMGANSNFVNTSGLSTGQTSASASSTNNKNRVKCTASARTINCQHHCVAILATRLFTLLCNEQAFQQKLISENQEVCFNIIIDVLYPNNDPVRIK